jgi:hypothetical protein
MLELDAMLEQQAGHDAAAFEHELGLGAHQQRASSRMRSQARATSMLKRRVSGAPARRAEDAAALVVGRVERCA